MENDKGQYLLENTEIEEVPTVFADSTMEITLNHGGENTVFFNNIKE